MNSMALLRRANDSDLEPVKNLLIENNQKPTIVFNERTLYFIAEVDKQIIGTIGAELSDHAALIRSTAVLKQWRSGGIAARLVAMMFQSLKENGVRNFYLFSRDSGPYWQKFGFEQCAVREIIDHLPDAPQVLGYLDDNSIWTDVAWRLFEKEQ